MAFAMTEMYLYNRGSGGVDHIIFGVLWRFYGPGQKMCVRRVWGCLVSELDGI